MARTKKTSTMYPEVVDAIAIQVHLPALVIETADVYVTIFIRLSCSNGSFWERITSLHTLPLKRSASLGNEYLTLLYFAIFVAPQIPSFSIVHIKFAWFAFQISGDVDVAIRFGVPSLDCTLWQRITTSKWCPLIARHNKHISFVCRVVVPLDPNIINLSFVQVQFGPNVFSVARNICVSITVVAASEDGTFRQVITFANTSPFGFHSLFEDEHFTLFGVSVVVAPYVPHTAVIEVQLTALTTAIPGNIDIAI